MVNRVNPHHHEDDHRSLADFNDFGVFVTVYLSEYLSFRRYNDVASFVRVQKNSREVSQLLQPECGLKCTQLSVECLCLYFCSKNQNFSIKGGKSKCGEAKAFLVRKILIFF